MSSNPDTTGASKKMLWAGYIISGLLVLALTAIGVLKFTPPNEEALKEFERIGWAPKMAIMLGILELTCTALYAIPRTSVLGAILLTGYLGGAIATHVRVGDDFIFQAILGVLVWLGLYFRDARLRVLIPLRS